MSGQPTRPRACGECGAAITRQSRSGLCRLHAMRRLHADPDYRDRRLAGLRAYCASPAGRERLTRQWAEWRATMSEEERQRRREQGHRMVRDYLSRPDIRARAQSPEARARRGARGAATKFGWCPDALRPAYHRLVRAKRIPAIEARRIIEAEIAGTVEHARREIASRDLATRLRDERRQQEAY